MPYYTKKQVEKLGEILSETEMPGTCTVKVGDVLGMIRKTKTPTKAATKWYLATSDVLAVTTDKYGRTLVRSSLFYLMDAEEIAANTRALESWDIWTDKAFVLNATTREIAESAIKLENRDERRNA